MKRTSTESTPKWLLLLLWLWVPGGTTSLLAGRGPLLCLMAVPGTESTLFPKAIDSTALDLSQLQTGNANSLSLRVTAVERDIKKNYFLYQLKRLVLTACKLHFVQVYNNSDVNLHNFTEIQKKITEWCLLQLWGTAPSNKIKVLILDAVRSGILNEETTRQGSSLPYKWHLLQKSVKTWNFLYEQCEQIPLQDQFNSHCSIMEETEGVQ